MIQTVIKDFKTYLDKKYAYTCSASMFHWDQSTGAPKGGRELKGKLVGFLSGEAFAMTISPEMKHFLDVLGQHTDELDELTLGLYKRCKREYDALAKIPTEEYAKFCELQVSSEGVWAEAKQSSQFALFAPSLKKMIDYNKKFIDYRGFKGHPYNTLLDDYEPDITVSDLDTYFHALRTDIVNLLDRIRNAKKQIRTDFLSFPVSKEKQKQISEMLMAKLGYDLDRGMLKESEHPFTLDFGQTDVRITTNYKPNQFLESFYSVIHEVGHALYEQNKREDIQSTFMDSGVSMAIHESQSRFFENIIGRSLAFWELIYDDLMAILGDSFKGITAKEFYEASNIVTPNLIRITADELTYSLHIMIRYELEKYILSNDIDVNALPKRWNEKYQQYLGLTPSNDAEGILQDVHWSGGAFGYFPSYSLGSAYAAQFLHYMQKEFDVYEKVRNGEINVITDWLKTNIHQYGSLRTPKELITAIHNEELDSKYYVAYLKNKYEAIYEL